jgi:hypothetical protein
LDSHVFMLLGKRGHNVYIWRFWLLTAWSRINERDML